MIARSRSVESLEGKIGTFNDCLVFNIVHSRLQFLQAFPRVQLDNFDYQRLTLVNFLNNIVNHETRLGDFASLESLVRTLDCVPARLATYTLFKESALTFH